MGLPAELTLRIRAFAQRYACCNFARERQPIQEFETDWDLNRKLMEVKRKRKDVLLGDLVFVDI